MSIEIEKVRAFLPREDLSEMKRPLRIRIENTDHRVGQILKNVNPFRADRRFQQVREISQAVRPYRNLLSLIEYLESVLYPESKVEVDPIPEKFVIDLNDENQVPIE